MDPSMELPPPAPPDAFSLDDDVPVPQHATLQQPQQATSAVGPPRNISTAVSQQQGREQHAELPGSTVQDWRRQQQQQQQQPAGAAERASSAATADSKHLGQAIASLTGTAAGVHMQQQQQQTPAAEQQLTVSAPAQQHADTAAQRSASGGVSAQFLAGGGNSQLEIQPPEQQKIAELQQQLQLQPLPQQAGQQTGHRQQPRDLTGLLSQLSDNAEAIAAAEEVLGGLLARQAALHHMGRKMEQQQVLAVLQQGHLGFSKGRPVAAVLLYRCLQHWGLLQQTEPCPFLEQLSYLLQSQLDLDDASAPAEVAGLQCHVADSLALSAVLYCVLLKASHPELAAAAAAEHSRAPKQLHSAAEVVAAARKRVSATWQQGVAHMGPGLQALGKLKLGGWGFKRSDDTAAAAGSRSSSTSSHAPLGSLSEQHESVHASTDATPYEPAVAAAAVAGASATSPAGTAAAAAATGVSAESLHAAAPLAAFMLCLDHLVQHSYILLRDQLKRRLTPLLADCVSPNSDNVMTGSYDTDAMRAPASYSAAAAAAAVASAGQPLSPSAAGAAVAGSAAESAAHAEAALMNYRSWSELVGVLHAALVALRAAHVPRSLRAALMQQVLEFVNCQLFNQLLLRPECCSVSNARYALRGLKQLDTWITAEQSAASHCDLTRGDPTGRHTSHSVTGVGSTHGSSFNSQAPSPQGPTAAAVAVAEGAAASKLGGSDSSSAAADGSSGATAEHKPATAAAAGGDDEDGGWEQVPADTGEFDTWQPSQQQQQQQQQHHYWWLNKQQQPARGAAEQPELGPEAWNALAHVRQSLQFLVFDSKDDLSLEDLTEHVCPALNHQQLYRLCTTAWSDAPDTPTDDGAGGGVSGEVLEQMKQLYTLNSNGGLIVTFLLDEPSGPLPFVQPPAAAAAATDGSSGSAARCRLRAVVGWDDGRDYGVGLKPVPAALVDKGCPIEVFEFVTVDQAWPPSRHGH